MSFASLCWRGVLEKTNVKGSPTKKQTKIKIKITKKPRVALI